MLKAGDKVKKGIFIEYPSDTSFTPYCYHASHFNVMNENEIYTITNIDSYNSDEYGIIWCNLQNQEGHGINNIHPSTCLKPVLTTPNIWEMTNE